MSSFTVASFILANLSVLVDRICERELDLPLLDGEMPGVELLFPSRVKCKRQVVEKWCCNSVSAMYLLKGGRIAKSIYFEEIKVFL